MNCGKEREVEADERDDRRDLAPELGVHAAEHFRPPEVQAAKGNR